METTPALARWTCLLMCLHLLASSTIQAVEPAAMEPQATEAPASAADLGALKKEILTQLQTARPVWTDDQRLGLADHIVTLLKEKMGTRLTPLLCTNISRLVGYDLKYIALDYLDYGLTREHYRWAIEDLAKRKPLTAEQIKERDAGLKDLMDAFAEAFKKRRSPDDHPSILARRDTYLQIALDAAHDELYPGLKEPLPRDQFGPMQEKAFQELYHIKTFFDDPKPPGKQTKVEDEPEDIETGFKMLGGQFFDRGVQRDGAYQKALVEMTRARRAASIKRWNDPKLNATTNTTSRQSTHWED